MIFDLYSSEISAFLRSVRVWWLQNRLKRLANLERQVQDVEMDAWSEIGNCERVRHWIAGRERAIHSELRRING